MTFGSAVKAVLSQYATFNGRARRSEYWWYALFAVIVGVIANVIDAGIGAPALSIIVGLGLLLPGLAVSVRRLHDTGKSGWMVLLGLIPLVGAILLIVFMATDGNPAPNAHGPSPKAA